MMTEKENAITEDIKLKELDSKVTANALNIAGISKKLQEISKELSIIQTKLSAGEERKG